MRMPSSYQIELKSWLRKIDILQQENVMLKNKVADVMKNDMDRVAVEKVENYLANFLEKDAILALLRRDIAEEMKKAGYYQNEEESDTNEKKQASLRKDIAQMEFEFYKLKGDFTNYISDMLSAA